ncbi:DNA-directed RNA polymerase subunit beta [Sporosarcina sp. G11-34]|uniref:DNA-directed RNA polymerase subunit beta n=1 Tax=Sporosarcina sp. G11-34 TaxID=2849605 RepID=UPI0022A90E47|nr:DNA-directed RNA polymerase subunit beta [Sporosarcina sp. G11-34]MCZ2257550.1 DNA-directed RNA polymerase subunit beta [Sporosarcina sp. G11-34]
MNNEKQKHISRNILAKSKDKLTSVFLRFKRKKEKLEKVENEGKVVTEKTLWVQIRMIPIWLRIILVALLIAGAALLGVIVGYGYMGDGNPADALKKETWTHIIDIIKGKES